MPPGFEYLRPYDAFVSMAPIAGSRNVLSTRQSQRVCRRRTSEAGRHGRGRATGADDDCGPARARIPGNQHRHRRRDRAAGRSARDDRPHDAARALRRRRLPAAHCLRQRRESARGTRCGAPARARRPRRARRRTAAPDAPDAGREHLISAARRRARRALCDLAAARPRRGRARRHAADSRREHRRRGAAVRVGGGRGLRPGVRRLSGVSGAGSQGQQALIRGRSTGFAARSHRLRRGADRRRDGARHRAARRGWSDDPHGAGADAAWTPVSGPITC